MSNKKETGKSGADNEEKTQTGENEVDDSNMEMGENHSRMSEVKSSGDEGENLSVNEDDIQSGIQAKEMKEDDASLNRGDKIDFCRVDEEKKTDKNNQKATASKKPHVTEDAAEQPDEKDTFLSYSSVVDSRAGFPSRCPDVDIICFPLGSPYGDAAHAGQWEWLSNCWRSLKSFFGNAARKWGFCGCLNWKWLPYLTLTQTRHYGLYNQGAICYLNSVLQVLSKTTELHNRLDTTKETDLHLTNIFEGLKEATCRTETITAAFGIQDVHEQRDAAECLEMILRKISPQASEVFKGALTYTTNCSRGHKIIEETNAFWTLPLALKDAHDSSYSVERSFERIFQSKSFNGGNMLYCNDCEEKTETESGCEMVSPQILTLLLKRFDFDDNTGTYFKSDCCVDVPHELQRNDKKYELYAMVNHFGSLRGGHYTATIRSNEDNTWYEFDDTHVYKVKEQPFAETNSYNSGTVYLLMYRAPSEQQPGRNSQTNPADTVVQVHVRGLRGTTKTMDLCDTVKQFMSITVLQLKEKIIEGLDDIVLPEDQLILISSGCELKDHSFLSGCGIQNMSTIDVVLRLPGGGLPPEEGDGGMGDKGGTNRSMENLTVF